ncbi:MAG: hypothetical protein Q8K92_08915 [Leadbetterella sp.]|nr:hypothetical protein [Leadbetterella sp.]
MEAAIQQFRIGKVARRKPAIYEFSPDKFGIGKIAVGKFAIGNFQKIRLLARPIFILDCPVFQRHYFKNLAYYFLYPKDTTRIKYCLCWK